MRRFSKGIGNSFGYGNGFLFDFGYSDGYGYGDGNEHGCGQGSGNGCGYYYNDREFYDGSNINYTYSLIQYWS